MKIKNPKKQRHFVEQNPWEVLGGGLKQAVIEDLGKGSKDDLLTQLLNKADVHEIPRSSGGDMAAGEEITFEEKKETHQITEFGEELRREVLHSGKIASNENSQEIHVKIQEILIEIKQLANSSEQLKNEVEVVAMEQATENPGVYHINFVEMILSQLRSVREDVEDGLAWFQALGSKKKSMKYGAQAKKHGTSFTLSNERVVATQTG